MHGAKGESPTAPPQPLVCSVGTGSAPPPPRHPQRQSEGPRASGAPEAPASVQAWHRAAPFAGPGSTPMGRHETRPSPTCGAQHGSLRGGIAALCSVQGEGGAIALGRRQPNFSVDSALKRIGSHKFKCCMKNTQLSTPKVLDEDRFYAECSMTRPGGALRVPHSGQGCMLEAGTELHGTGPSPCSSTLPTVQAAAEQSTCRTVPGSVCIEPLRPRKRRVSRHRHLLHRQTGVERKRHMRHVGWQRNLQWLKARRPLEQRPAAGQPAAMRLSGDVRQQAELLCRRALGSSHWHLRRSRCAWL